MQGVITMDNVKGHRVARYEDTVCIDFHDGPPGSTATSTVRVRMTREALADLVKELTR